MIKRRCNPVLWVAGLVTVTCLVMFGCTQNKTATPVENTESNSSMSESPSAFQMVTIPAIITDPQDRANYLAEHYWDEFNFADTACLNQADITEQAFVNYLDLFNHVDKQTLNKSVQKMLTQVNEQDTTELMSDYFLKLYKSYLYDPNSPFRNEEHYLPVVNYILEHPSDDLGTQERAQYDRTNILKNRVGEQAANFNYVRKDGKHSNLYNLKTEYTILYFYNPDCPACRQTTQQLIASENINRLLDANRLTILATYTEDDESLWKQHLGDYPSSWIHAYDDKQLITTKRLYDLRAIPCLYLLDVNKRVLLKDADVTAIEGLLDAV